MPFTLIAGTFHVLNYSPDGDSIRFRPNNLNLLKSLPGGPPKINTREHVQLRIEGIDTLETHYSPPTGGGTFHQPPKHAKAAVEALLRFTSISDVKWSVDGKAIVSAKDGTPGYILTREVEKYGRPVAFVFAGNPAEQDGSLVVLDVPRLHQSYNNLALRDGLAYPTYYTGLFADLRDEMSKTVRIARESKKGIHADDATVAGFAVETLADITDKYVILPKLFRRLSEYFSDTGSIRGFKATLEQAQEPVLDLRTSNFTHFDTFVNQPEGSVRIALTRQPEELVFGPMNERVGSTFSQVLAQSTFEIFGETAPSETALA